MEIEKDRETDKMSLILDQRQIDPWKQNSGKSKKEKENGEGKKQNKGGKTKRKIEKRNRTYIDED